VSEEQIKASLYYPHQVTSVVTRVTQAGKLKEISSTSTEYWVLHLSSSGHSSLCNTWNNRAVHCIGYSALYRVAQKSKPQSFVHILAKYW